MEAQTPFAIVLGCADSRVPPEVVFDQGLGDLFVVRVAGNIAAPTQVGSIELAVESFDTRLVVVLGHERCSAIAAALADIESTAAPISGSLRTIVNRVRPSIEPLLESSVAADREQLVHSAVRANVEAAAANLAESPVLAPRVARGELEIVGAAYALDSGAVEIFD
ncbi:MAG: carbonic anhydrase [Acidobacteriota bacterium]|nr:carbonic anhydrase [Acidobacteriota bacterium]